jgi:hypothetical protein
MARMHRVENVTEPLAAHLADVNSIGESARPLAFLAGHYASGGLIEIEFAKLSLKSYLGERCTLSQVRV